MCKIYVSTEGNSVRIFCATARNPRYRANHVPNPGEFLVEQDLDQKFNKNAKLFIQNSVQLFARFCLVLPLCSVLNLVYG